MSSIQGLVRGGVITFNTLLVGSGAVARDTFRELRRTGRHLGLQLVGFTPLTDVVDEQLAAELPARGSFHQLPALIPALNIEQIIIAIEPNEHRVIEQILTLLEGTPAA